MLAGEPKKMKIKILARKPIVKVIHEEAPREAPREEMRKSIWMSMRRIPKVNNLPILWESVEDISDDENDTPATACERASKMKAMSEAIRRQAYEERLDELQAAGLFLTWRPVKPLKTHSNYDYRYCRLPTQAANMVSGATW
jgi:hypothetical protein